jgi:glycosyltransferase involved in cell wall biosynthesis
MAARTMSVTALPKTKFSLLLISYSYPPVIGGSEIEAQRVCAALQSRGHRVKVLCAGGDPMPPVTEWVDACGLLVRIFGGKSSTRLRPRVFAAGVAWTLAREWRSYQVAYFLMPGLQVALGVPVARLMGKRVIMKFSGSGEIKRLEQSWVGRLELRLLRRLAHRILILNPGMRQEAEAAGFEQAQLMWMPNPVDTSEFCPCDINARPGFRSELDVPQQAQVVIFVGRLSPEKELPSLLGAFARVARELPEAILVVVGDGPMRGKLMNRTRELGLERRVHFTGMLDSVAVRKWLQVSDVYALVSSLEGLPCALLEAMAAGLPPVISNIPANTQIVQQEKNGLVAELKNEESIAQQMIRLLRDPELRVRLGDASRLHVLENFSGETVTDIYEGLLERLYHARD